MAITRFGYTGTVNQEQWSRLLALLGVNYAVGGDNDLKVTAVGGLRRVSIAAGFGAAAGVAFDSSVATLIDIPAPGAGRWHLVYAEFNWAAKTVQLLQKPADVTLVAPQTVPPNPPILANTAGVAYEMPLAFVWVNASNTNVYVLDLRKMSATARLLALENPVIVAPFEGTVVQRNARLGIPATLAQEVALQNLRQSWFNTTSQCTERYYARYDATLNPSGRAVVSSWYPVSGITPRASGGGLSNFSVPNATFTLADYDPGLTLLTGGVTISASGVVTIGQPGSYRVWGVVTFAPNATGQRIIQLRKGDGSIVAAAGVPSSSSSISSVDVEAIVDFVAGETIAPWFYQNSGGALNASPSGGYKSAFVFEYKGPSKGIV